jgi:hypothetical protein
MLSQIKQAGGSDATGRGKKAWADHKRGNDVALAEPCRLLTEAAKTVRLHQTRNRSAGTYKRSPEPACREELALKSRPMCNGHGDVLNHLAVGAQSARGSCRRGTDHAPDACEIGTDHDRGSIEAIGVRLDHEQAAPVEIRT